MLRYHRFLRYKANILWHAGNHNGRIHIVPPAFCEHLTTNNIYVKAFMLEAEAERYSQVVRVLQQMLFKRLDQRVAGY